MKQLRGVFLGLGLSLAMAVVAGTIYNYFPPPGITYGPTTGTVFGTATGGAQGTGTVNAQGLFINGVAAITSASVPTGASPTASLGLSANNGVATTFMRSDASPPLSQAIAPIWSAKHLWSQNSASFVDMTGVCNTNATSGSRCWTVTLSPAGVWNLFAANDSGVSPFADGTGQALKITRSSGAVAGLQLGNTTDNPTFTFAGTGQVSIGGGTVVGSPTGGNQGAGTINMQGCFVNGVACSTGGAAGANPTGTIGLTAVNGSAGTFLRSDGAPALSQAIAPTWTGLHIFGRNATNAPAFGESLAASAPTNGVAATFFGPTTGAQGFNIDFQDTTNTVTRGFIGFGSSTVTGAAVTDFAIAPGTSGSVVIGTANGGAIGTRFGPNGNVTINAPTSGTAFSVTALSGQPAAQITGAGTGLATIFNGGGTAVGNLESSDVSRTNKYTFGRDNASTGNWVLAYNGTELENITSAGNLTKDAPSSGISETINGLNNQTTLQITGGATAGQSFGITNNAGTNSSDWSALFNNSTGTTNYLKIAGDGGIIVGSPTGGDVGLGTINIPNGYYLNGNTGSSSGGEWTTAGAVMGGATGGVKGGGTLNATGLYVNGASVTAGGIASCLANVSGTTLTLTRGLNCASPSRAGVGHYQFTVSGFSTFIACTAISGSPGLVANAAATMGNPTIDLQFATYNGTSWANTEVPGAFHVICVGT